MKIKQLKQKLSSNSWFLFLFYFVLWVPLDYFLIDNERNLKQSLVVGLINAIVLTLVLRYTSDIRNPIYFKLNRYDHLLEYLEKINAQLVKTKNEKQYYKLIGKQWPNNKIIIKKTPFYLYADVPEKLVDEFLQLRDVEEKA